MRKIVGPVLHLAPRDTVRPNFTLSCLSVSTRPKSETAQSSNLCDAPGWYSHMRSFYLARQALMPNIFCVLPETSQSLAFKLIALKSLSCSLSLSLTCAWRWDGRSPLEPRSLHQTLHLIFFTPLQRFEHRPFRGSNGRQRRH